MGSNESHTEGEPEPIDPNANIKINVESGFTGGNPRQWHGTLIATIFVRPDSTVASLLSTVQSLPLDRGHWPVTLSSLGTGKFRPTDSDLQRTVREMDLVSGTLRIHNGKTD